MLSNLASLHHPVGMHGQLIIRYSSGVFVMMSAASDHQAAFLLYDAHLHQL